MMMRDFPALGRLHVCEFIAGYNDMFAISVLKTFPVLTMTLLHDPCFRNIVTLKNDVGV
jgi:hypothetical protein